MALSVRGFEARSSSIALCLWVRWVLRLIMQGSNSSLAPNKASKTGESAVMLERQFSKPSGSLNCVFITTYNYIMLIKSR